jgi:TolA-binding protein
MQKNVTIRVFTALLAVLSTATLWAQAGVAVPRTASPAAQVSQTIGISTATVSYSRPAVKGRTVWGELVPYGWNKQPFGSPADAPWRAGANENTTLELSHPAKVAGQTVPAGKYGLFLVINKDDSGEVILSKDNRSWGNFFYDPAQDQMRAKIQVRNMPQSTELLTYDFINLTKNTAELVLNWEKKQFPISLEFAVDDIVMANAAAELKSGKGFTAPAYISAVNYAIANKTNLETALGWADRAITIEPSFANISAKARILKMTGKTAEADKLMSDALPKASEGELNQYGYQVLGEGKHDEAIKVLAMNTERHPESANAWDSLGEAYATKGDKENAIKNFKKALSLNPADNVKANSEKYLKQLGAMK